MRASDHQASGSSAEARHAAVGTLQSFAAGLLAIPTGLITAAFLTRRLGPESYGLLAVAVTIVMWIELAAVTGLGRTAVRLVADTDDWRPAATKLIQVQLAIAFGAALLLFASADLLAALLHSPVLAGRLRLVSLDVPIMALTTIHGTILVGRGRFGQRAVLNAVYWLSRMVFILILVGLHPVVDAALLALVGASAATFAMSRVFVRPPLLIRSSYPLERIWAYAWPLFFFTVATHMFSSVDLLFVKALVPRPEAAGFYGAAKNLTILPASFAASLAPLLLAKLTHLSRSGDVAAARGMARRSVRLTLCMLPFAAMASGAAEEIVVLVYGPSFAPAAPILAVLMFAAVGASVIPLAASMLIADGRPRITALVAVPLALLAFALHSVAVPLWDWAGAAAVRAGVAWLGAAVLVAIAHRRWRLLPLSPTLLRCCLASVPAWAIAALWPTSGLLVVVKLLLTSAVILGCFVITGELDQGDLIFVRSLLRRSEEAS